MGVEASADTVTSAADIPPKLPAHSPVLSKYDKGATAKQGKSESDTPASPGIPLKLPAHSPVLSTWDKRPAAKPGNRAKESVAAGNRE